MEKNEFISVHDALPALNCLVEYKNLHGDFDYTRIIMDTNKPFLLWLGLGGASLRTPKYLTHWRYVEKNKSIRNQEALDWLAAQPYIDEQE